MINLPKGVWRWISDNARDLSRIATALEKTAEEIARIRTTLEHDEEREENR